VPPRGISVDFMLHHRLSRTALAALLLTTALTAGCSDDSAPLLGEWKLRNENGDVLRQYNFGADGSFEFLSSGEGITLALRTSGTYTADGDELVLDGFHVDSPDQPIRGTFTYYVDEERFSNTAALPDAEPDGIVGTWRQRFEWETVAEDGTRWIYSGVEVELDIRADQTMSLTTTDLTEAIERTGDGTWALDVPAEDGLERYEVQYPGEGYILLEWLTLTDAPSVLRSFYQR
jgi:hypothetical protein